MTVTEQPAVLTIAGSDSGGGAGIQADLKVFTANGCYGASVAVALTAQNTRGVQAVYASPPAFIEQQLRSVLDDIPIKAMKTGMLFDVSSICTVVQVLRSHYAKDPESIPPLVCDPVCVSTSGHNLLQPDAVNVLVSELLPLVFLFTPNKSEAEIILSSHGLEPSDIIDLEGMVEASQALLTLGPKNVLLKGGHLTTTYNEVLKFRAARPDVRMVSTNFDGENTEILQAAGYDTQDCEVVVDVLRTPQRVALFLHPRVDSTSTHGTGCTLSAAIASQLAHGKSVNDGTALAIEYTHTAIESAIPIGKGHSPLNHGHALIMRTIPKATPRDPYPFVRMLIQSTTQQWKAYVEHQFVQQMARGTLPLECLQHVTKQGALYLKYYGRAHGLLVAKSSSSAEIKAASNTIIDVLNEVSPSNTARARWGVTDVDIHLTPESTATTAYGAFLMDCGLRGDGMSVTMAAAACLIGYGEVGLWFKKEQSRPGTWVVVEGNPYAQWFEQWSGEQYQTAVKTGMDILETIAAEDSPSPARFEEWRTVWERCTELERGFWDMALQQS
ncbi:Phosphomethylpyrimidine kinase-domain-containing protein [Irpex rosettiformis]|uniref:Phosphomethylpyrimidine kinase-domain-containing protein n=1 Tax=Irpex rosettiformis TaxID=378272 RepID=A0ACB8TVF4_9APHY|nr:Phosphomethylpyrimidine kinase-domain-containing protein [Irpex rosettiformis]